MNRHYPSEAPDIWRSYEWLQKERLESIDYIARRMYSELVNCRMRSEDEKAYMRERFADL